GGDHPRDPLRGPAVAVGTGGQGQPPGPTPFALVPPVFEGGDDRPSVVTDDSSVPGRHGLEPLGRLPQEQGRLAHAPGPPLHPPESVRTASADFIKATNSG